ncbi:uncharacterized protein LOC106638141 [Copidosoma floridanum]|uniref:uncharacterized protein LOC106638141 n=1 Tax=Copidosoma floridanum TaxID=29053 RepID=UPI0006C9CE97|nr:uncharacterized protein LOC106638141 [Copidosoma floridanum]
MADTEFEQFRFYFDRLPQHFKAPSDSYTLVHGVMLDESPTSSQESDNEAGRSCVGATIDSEDEEVVVLHRHHEAHSGHSSADEECEQMCCSSIVADSDFSLFAGLSSSSSCSSNNGDNIGGGGGGGGGLGRARDSGLGSEVGEASSSWPTPEHQPRSAGLGERRRRLPEIPRRRCESSCDLCFCSGQSKSFTRATMEGLMGLRIV